MIFIEPHGGIYDPNIHGISRVTLFVEAPEILERVMNEVTKADIVDWSKFKIYEDDAVYQERVKPLQTMILITTGFLFAFTLGALIGLIDYDVDHKPQT